MGSMRDKAAGQLSRKEKERSQPDLVSGWHLS